MENMRILVACEESQAVCKAMRERGHEAYSADIQACSGGHLEWHFMGDVLAILEGGTFSTCDGVEHTVEKWDMVIAFPPCTYMTKAGANHMFKGGVLNEERFKKAIAARDFFFRFLNCSCPRVAIENPTPMHIVGLPKETQAIQPYMFGHDVSKRTCLWLKGLPNLVPTDIVEEHHPYLYSRNWKGKGIKFAEGSVQRSKTFSGVSEAMAMQWA